MAALRTDQLYEAILDDEQFNHLPGLLAQATGASRSSINAYYDGGCDILQCSNFDPGFLDAVVSGGFAAKDPWLGVGLDPANQKRVLNAGDFLSREAFERSEFYNELLRPRGDKIFHCLGAASPIAQNGLITVGVFRDANEEPFGAAEQATLASALAPVNMIVKTRALLARERSKSSTRAAALSAFGLGVFVVGRNGRLVDVNAAGEAMLSCSAWLRLQSGKLTFGDPANARRLERLIAEATAASAPRHGAMRLESAHMGGPLLTVAPLKDVDRSGLALLLVQAPGARDASLGARLKTLYGLTSAEADLAVLLGQGLSPAEAAQAREVSVQTVRTQLKIIVAKIGISRQSELAALVGSIPKLHA